MSGDKRFKLVLQKDCVFECPDGSVVVNAGARIELVDGVACIAPEAFPEGSTAQTFAFSNGFRVNDLSLIRIEVES